MTREMHLCICRVPLASIYLHPTSLSGGWPQRPPRQPYECAEWDWPCIVSEWPDGIQSCEGIDRDGEARRVDYQTAHS